ncbi:hypothetical protein PQB71_gp88 [Mycobacterium phage Taptic]|uniref:Uncharacterized protein n=1 Tax=Mycobacterium phage Taptic TaxID=1920305 RepID=A0A1J0MDZ2_9CAUD|nr:hypothetical protein PQB71_gp88 [Mycobacterium phage Taptic]APD19321.1 hypothetical protein SEA_TAPTIC_77 [Mycobacterium phage Taptic]
MGGHQGMDARPPFTFRGCHGAPVWGVGPLRPSQVPAHQHRAGPGAHHARNPLHSKGFHHRMSWSDSGIGSAGKRKGVRDEQGE